MFKRISSFAANLARRLFRKRPPDPRPFAEVRAPLRRGPSSRGGAVALEEPRESRVTDLRGKLRP